MTRLQFARKPGKPAERNLRLVPPPKRRRRPRLKIGRIRKPKYESLREMHEWEEQIVLAALREFKYSASVRSLTKRWPGRFNNRQLWLTLVRLRGRGYLESTRGFAPKDHVGWVWWKYPVQYTRKFWLKEED